MVWYWYCAYIPPRPLDDNSGKSRQLERKRREKHFWTNRRIVKIKILKDFHKTLVAVCERRVGHWAVRR
jgi:hypothetical protein